jgi:uncharacterized membrane protein
VNLHPALASFPPVLILIAAALEIADRRGRFRTTIRLHLVLAVIFVTATFFTGYGASETANQTFVVADSVIATHHSVGRLLLFLIFPCAALEVVAHRAVHGRRLFFAAYALTLAACVLLVVYTGYLGGQLVFEHGAGVRATLPVTGS